MARKKFNINEEDFATTQETQEMQETSITQEKEETYKKVGRPIERPDTYRFSLYLDGDLKEYIKYASWKNRQNITQYLNELVRKDMEESIAKGDEGWKKKV